MTEEASDDLWDGFHEASKERRAQNRDFGAQTLTTRKIPFTSRNNGAHLIVACAGGAIDYWPGTGLFAPRPPLSLTSKNRGITPLVNYIEREEAKWKKNPETNAKRQPYSDSELNRINAEALLAYKEDRQRPRRR